MKKSILVLAVFMASFGFKTFASLPDEGMWLPMFVERLNYVDMQKMGLQLTPEEIYSINHSSLKDAIVGLNNGNPYGNFCTGEIISAEGLLLTNHHCGFGNIQSHSSVEHDYLKDGFWAMSRKEELPNEKLSVSALVRMEDVTKEVLKNITDNMSEQERADSIAAIIEKIKVLNSENDKYNVVVKSFFGGNEYYMFIYITYRDVRLVGAPPSSIGKFGGDTDNWMWPRHTGDFSMFRIYTAPDGSPAEYSENNVPLKPKHHLPVSLDGVQKNDFAMIWGYPGSTERYLTSYGVKLAIEEYNPTVVKIRDKKLAIMREDMDASQEIRIQYASKYARTSNYWKYYIGQTKGLKRLKVYDKKLSLEQELSKWIESDNARKQKYGNALSLIEKGYNDSKKYTIPNVYIEEAIFGGAESFGLSIGALRLYKYLDGKKSSEIDQEQVKASVAGLSARKDDYFKDFNKATDLKIFAALLEMYYTNVPKEMQAAKIGEIAAKYKNDFNAFANDAYNKSVFVDKSKLEAFINEPTLKVLKNDPIFQITFSIYQKYMEMADAMETAQVNIKHGERLFIAALREMNPNKIYYPDANSTMRVTYGKVLDYYPADAIHYNFYTTLEGIMEKEDPNNDEFIVPERLKELFLKKDYGKYGKEGKMNVAFLTDNDITGGNSGSPVINGKGQLIGLAFDGNWEAMSGDIAFEPQLQRTISADIRYVLFIIDKFAGATHLVDEMTLVKDNVIISKNTKDSFRAVQGATENEK